MERMRNMELTTQEVPKSNQTKLGLYATPREANEMWEADPDNVTILDVRSFEEYVFVGHPLMAKNVPLAFLKYERPPVDAEPMVTERGVLPPGFSVEPNTEFLPEVKSVCGPDDTILVLCGSGGRAAKATDMLAAAGFTKVYNIVNGFEGELVVDPASPDFGQNKDNGWMPVGLPWGRKINPDLMWENAKQD
jgi:rhodanese-related sulfurtransferase